MTDRELLEAAAKAAGVALTPMEIKNVNAEGDDHFIGFMTDAKEWPRGWFNPLTDDGDALQLAVKLGLDVSTGGEQTDVVNSDGTLARVELHEADPCAATRRAIVRAAAAHPGPREGVDT